MVEQAVHQITVLKTQTYQSESWKLRVLALVNSSIQLSIFNPTGFKCNHVMESRYSVLLHVT
jgi:hypothetical protein